MRVRSALIVGGLVLLTGTTAAHSAGPDSPHVQQMLKRANAFLLAEDAAMQDPGQDALIGLALFKSGYGADHPRVRQSIEHACAFARTVPRNGLGSTCYGPAICAILLSDVDAQLYREDIGLIVDGLLQRQRPNGSWGYQPYTYDDTSQTQYAVLSLWTASQNGLEVPADALERVADWVITTQHPDGGWSYIPPQQPGIGIPRNYTATHSMASAGAGMSYMLAHLFGLGSPATGEQNGLPPALKAVEDQTRRIRFRADGVNRTAFENTMRQADNWIVRNMRFDIPFWTHYYMYGLERYKSFKSLVEGRTEEDPAWYRQGVDYLRTTQAANGSWASTEATGSNAAIDTSFAVLFLVRSSQQTIDKTLLEGQLRGGKGLPKDLSKIRVESGQVVSLDAVQDIDDLLKLLENEDAEDLDPSSLRDKLILDPDPAKRSEQLPRLRRLVDHKNYQVRLSAVEALGSIRDLDNVPALVHALSDPDRRVAKAALDALRFNSRRFETPNLPAEANPSQVRAVQDYWKNWYQSIDPNAAFFD